MITVLIALLPVICPLAVAGALAAAGAGVAYARRRSLLRPWRRLVSAILGPPYGSRPPAGTRAAKCREWHERAYFHLSEAEWDSRIQIGMSLWHPERLAYELPNPEAWDALEDRADLWPGGEWVGVIEEHWREQEQRRRRG